MQQTQFNVCLTINVRDPVNIVSFKYPGRPHRLFFLFFSFFFFDVVEKN